MWDVNSLLNESDVEQKFIYPLLSEPTPLGLGLPPSVIQSKANLKRFTIGKGADQKSYFPDYVIVTHGYPLVVIEAKHPKESISEGYRQARLYAVELNALWHPDFNPAKYIIATNGVEIWYGYSDTQEPKGIAKCAELNPYSPFICELIKLMSWDNLHSLAESLDRLARPSEFFKPRKLIGGLGTQNEELAPNTFGATLTSSISSIFNPIKNEDRKQIAMHAYVPSRRRERYVDPIDRVIRAAKPPSEVDAIQFEDTNNPKELIGKLNNHKELEHKVLLLIGSVGSGKSTFIDHLIESALPKSLIDETVICRIDMNPAPVSADEIYSWLRRQIIKSCKSTLSSLDFEDLEIIKKVYAPDINSFNKGVGRLYANLPDTYNIKLAELIESCQKNETTTVNSIVRFTCGDRSKLLIVVLDNCDKKNRDEQLLMFEAAQWLQREFRCLVILPLRDETYDAHRNEPPLDTALKDLVFRIEPPLFQQVLMKRVQLAMKSLVQTGRDTLQFSLPNGYTVEYPKSDQAYYLTSIIKSLFEHDRFVRRMIVGLSGRNMRRALEIFLEFCNSGHIGDDQIFKIRQSEGKYTIPFHQVATVLLRMNRRFYDSDHSYVKNLFSSSSSSNEHTYFSRYMILKWLAINFNQTQSGGQKGYFSKRKVKAELVPFGFSPDVIDVELNYLLAAQCIIAEHLKVDFLADEDLIRLGPAGFVHLELISNVNYLAAVAEDTYFNDRILAERVLGKMRDIETQFHISSAINNATEVINYLMELKARMIPPNGSFMENDLFLKLLNFDEANEAGGGGEMDRVGWGILRLSKSQWDRWCGWADWVWLGLCYVVVNIVVMGGLLFF